MYGERNNNRRGGGFGGPKPPMNVGDEIDVHIEAVGEKGDGLAKVKGFVLFVPGTQAGEDCRVKVTRVLRKVGFAEKIGEAQGPVESSEKKQEAPAAEPEETSEEESYEDTENFGEETPEDSGEEPSEEGQSEESEDIGEEETSEEENKE